MVQVSNFKTTLLGVDATLREALESMNASTLRVCLVVGDDRRLIGLATDGDVRRALLGGAGVDTPIREIMNENFFWMAHGEQGHAIEWELRRRNILQVPILDEKGRVVSLVSRFAPFEVEDVTVVIMAGGLGTRLRPLTNDTPKPLLPLAGKPIVERTIEALRDQGFRRFVLTLNYLGEKIEQHFGDGSHLDVSIDYVWETAALGTAGALSLLDRDGLGGTLLVLNGDVVTDMPFGDFVFNHVESGAVATMCVAEHSNKIDFGVVDFDDNNRLNGVVEKPSLRHYINAGIYCLSNDALDAIPVDQRFDMPHLFQTLNDGSGAVRVYPSDAFWVDVGRPEDYERIQHLYRTTQTFGDAGEGAVLAERPVVLVSRAGSSDLSQPPYAPVAAPPRMTVDRATDTNPPSVFGVRGQDDAVYVIGAIGTNHNGRRDHALQLVDAVAAAGANAVSLRPLRADVDGGPASPPIPQRHGSATNVVPFEGTQLSTDDHRAIIERCAERGLDLLHSAHDRRLADLAHDLGVGGYRIGRRDLGRLDLLRYLAAKGRPLVLSIGGATVSTIEAAVTAIEEGWPGGSVDLAILHGTSDGSSAPGASNLRAMRTVSAVFADAAVGWSDRGQSDAVGLAAAAFEDCRVIEKTVTLGRSMIGPDHRAAVEPRDFARFVFGVRTVSTALGDGYRRAIRSEAGDDVNGALVATRDLAAGHRLAASDLAMEPSADGTAPSGFDAIEGATLRTGLDKGQRLALSQLEFGERDGNRRPLHG